MLYKNCGHSGLKLPQFALGLWHNFGEGADDVFCERIIRNAFEQGITHFDLANNYGPPVGSAEIRFGKLLRTVLKGHRDELIISTKAGHYMWDGPYGDGSSRKSLLVSLDQSLKRLGLEYVDIFYSHRYDPDTPIEETVEALSDVVRQGKALYVGLSKYPPEQVKKAFALLKSNHTPCLIFQDRYSLLERKPEKEILQVVKEEGAGFIAFSPLAQGQLTDKYLQGIPVQSRASLNHFLKEEQVKDNLAKVKALLVLAEQRGQSLSQMALAWLLQNIYVNSVIIGVSRVEQLLDNLKALDKLNFSMEELNYIDRVLK